MSEPRRSNRTKKQPSKLDPSGGGGISLSSKKGPNKRTPASAKLPPRPSSTSSKKPKASTIEKKTTPSKNQRLGGADGYNRNDMEIIRAKLVGGRTTASLPGNRRVHNLQPFVLSEEAHTDLDCTKEQSLKTRSEEKIVPTDVATQEWMAKQAASFLPPLEMLPNKGFSDEFNGSDLQDRFKKKMKEKGYHVQAFTYKNTDFIRIFNDHITFLETLEVNKESDKESGKSETLQMMENFAVGSANLLASIQKQSDQIGSLIQFRENQMVTNSLLASSIDENRTRIDENRTRIDEFVNRLRQRCVL